LTSSRTASSGGARTREEAMQQAERAAGQPLTAIDARWGGAWVRVLRGDPPWPKPNASAVGEGPSGVRSAATPSIAPAGSRPWALLVLGLSQGATHDEVKRAFRSAALRTHPDHGGDEASFIAVKRAHDIAIAALGSPRRPRKRGR